MNLYQCEKWAQDAGFDSCEFYANFPTGRFKCKWLDAYFGLFLIPDLFEDEFLSVRNISATFPDLVCEPIEG